LSFVPVIAILFILVGIINQVGVLSRVSVLLDRTFERFGISGRSIVNLLTGFGCNVPAIMMARSTNTRKEKIVSILITPFIACSAKVIVFAFVSNMIFGQ
jgi:ferrous iron transport protein B